MIKSGRAPDYRDRAYAVRRVEPTRFQVLKGIVAQYLRDRLSAAEALKEIHDKKLYKEKYPSFEVFCSKEYGIGAAYAYRLLEAGEVRESLKRSPIGDTLKNEAQARALAAVPADERIEVLESVAESGPVTAKRITAVVTARKKAPAVIDVEPEPDKITARHPCPACGGTGFAE